MKRALKFLALSAFLLTASLPGFAQSTTGSGSASSSTHSTSTAKKKTVSKKHHSKREPTQKAPTPARISEIQTALERRGYYQGDPNGKWDSNTVNAMQKFQSENGLESSGKINALSLQKLGLGSSIAGVSAPKPVQPQPSKPAASSPSPVAASAPPQSVSAPAQSAVNTTTGAPSSLSTSSASPGSTAKPQQR
jgi:peptidoglycan hydrolase-like protein with peptidoglycan-binding domain